MCSFNNRLLLKYHFAAADSFVAVLFHFDVILQLVFLFAAERERVSVVTFCGVSPFEAMDMFVSEQVDGEQV